MSTLNLGILAHVDAGKTSLTERLLFDTEAIEQLGSVDAGDTVSAVEGVQAQTRVLMRTLRRLGLPTLIFVNKIDRAGARAEELLIDLSQRLSLLVVPTNAVQHIGTPRVRTVPHSVDDPGYRSRAAEVLAYHDDSVLAELVDGVVPPADRLWAGLARQTADARLHPVVFGSALLGEGVDTLLDQLRLLPAATSTGTGLDGVVFSIDQHRSGKRIAYVRLYSGELRARQRITCQRRDPDGGLSRYGGRVTAVEVLGSGAGTLTAGNIATISGLPGIRVGDRIGSATSGKVPSGTGHEAARQHFAPPALETIVVPPDVDAVELRTALSILADRDPLIRMRPLPGGTTSLLLYGEVQKEVIAATLRHEFGIEAVFEPSRIVHLERPIRTGEAYEEMSRSGFVATVGLRVEPAPPGTGTTYRVGIEPGYLLAAFHRAIEDAVGQSLAQGLSGWPVNDCTVTLIRGGYVSAGSTAGEFRNLTPLVLMAALAAAGTRVFEPCHRFELEVPADTAGTVLTRLTAAEADLRDTRPGAATWLLEGEIPARCVHEFQQRLPGVTRGEGAWSSRPQGDRPVTGAAPVRARTDGNPLDRQAYLQHLRQHGRR